MKSKLGKRALAALVAALLVAACAARCTAVHQPEPEPEPAPASGEVGTPEEDPAPLEGSLSERQEELIAGYGAAEREVVSLLSGSCWQTADGMRNVQFDDTTMAEADMASGRAFSPVTYAVAATDTSVQASEGATTELTTVVLECGDGRTRILAIGKTTQLDGEIDYVLSSGDFAVATSYLRHDEPTSVSAEGLTETMLGFIGGDAVPLDAALTEWCRTWCPAAKTATWEQSVTLDDAAGTVTFTMMLDSPESPSVAVAYDRATGKFEVGRPR